jgi:hypothetical protein
MSFLAAAGGRRSARLLVRRQTHDVSRALCFRLSRLRARQGGVPKKDDGMGENRARSDASKFEMQEGGNAHTPETPAVRECKLQI